MSASEQPDDQAPAESAEQVTELFDSLDGTKVIETEEFKRFLDHVPIAIVISKFIQGHQLTCYANPAFESLMGPTPFGRRAPGTTAPRLDRSLVRQRIGPQLEVHHEWA
jgi:hypothetical protein